MICFVSVMDVPRISFWFSFFVLVSCGAMGAEGFRDFQRQRKSNLKKQLFDKFEEPSDTRPNIILMLTDDQDVELGRFFLFFSDEINHG